MRTDRGRILSIATPTATLFDEIRNTARHDLKRLEKHMSLSGDEGPTEAELAIMEQLRRTLELSVLITDSFLDEYHVFATFLALRRRSKGQ